LFDVSLIAKEAIMLISMKAMSVLRTNHYWAV